MESEMNNQEDSKQNSNKKIYEGRDHIPKKECSGLGRGGQVIERWSVAAYITDDADTQTDVNYSKTRARSHELGFYTSYRTTCHVTT